MRKFASILLIIFLSYTGSDRVSAEPNGKTQPEVFVHYMPWFAAKPVSGTWGYHWTMNHFNPDEIKWNGKREVASRDYPLMGPYDSGDPDALECHVQLMKLAGVDGVIIDWYGIKDFNDYGPIHQNTLKLIEVVKNAGMKFTICYEDQTIKHMIKAGALKENKAIDHGREVLGWMAENWFSDPNYLKVGGQPVLLVFGPQHFSRDQFGQLLDELKPNRPKLYGLPDGRAKGPATFLWPPVSERGYLSKDKWQAALDKLYRSPGEEKPIGIVFPGFYDMYSETETQASYGHIDGRNGATFRETLTQAIQNQSPFIQIATWNDFGEGTSIEPTHEKGYRYLDIMHEQTSPSYSSEHIRLPIQLYHLRKKAAASKADEPRLRTASQLLLEGETDKAAELISRLKEDSKKYAVVFPGETSVASESSGYHFVTDIPYRNGKDVDTYAKNRCQLDIYYPKGDRPYKTVVWFHGGGISKGNKEIPVPLRNKGIAVVAANYRLSPKVAAPVYIDDAAAAVAWTLKNIDRYGAGRSESVYVSGHSAGGYLTSMVGLDRQWLKKYGNDTSDLAGLIPFSGHTITHFTVRKERGISGNRPVVDELAPLFHVRKDSPPMLLITGDREKELWGRYEENAYFWRMAQVLGHPSTELHELEGFDHGGMPEPAFPLLLEFMEQTPPISKK